MKINIQNSQKKVKLESGFKMLIRKCCIATLQFEKFAENAEIGVTLIDNDEIKRLNAEYRNNPTVTDVLSFPLGENGKYDLNPDTNAYQLGDIVISLEKAVEQSEVFNHSLRREIGFLTIHSMLHLLGYDHETPFEEREMRDKEESILAALDLSRNLSRN